MSSKARSTVSNGHNDGTRHTEALRHSVEQFSLCPWSFDVQGSPSKAPLSFSAFHSEGTTERSFGDCDQFLKGVPNRRQRKSSGLQEYDAKQQASSIRRGCSTSQGTVIINRAFDGQIQEQFGLQADAASADNIKQRSERGCYEKQDSRGTVRRRSMTLPVSEDDCLLGRGVNPRTGLVTPGGAAAAHDTQLDEAFHAQNISTSTKWRQQGNQWVSLGVDEPVSSHHVTRMPELDNPNTRGLHTPQRLRELKVNPDRQRSMDLHRSAVRNRVAERTHGRRQQQAEQYSNTSMPGSYPRSPDKQATQHRDTASTPNTCILRKPLATHVQGVWPAEVEGATSKRFNQSPQEILQTSFNDASRSFSAPSPYRTIYSPVDLDKVTSEDVADSATKPDNRKAGSVLPADRSFLGPHSLAATNQDQPLSISYSVSRLNLDKDLPCLPMSSGQYLQARSISSPLISTSERSEPVNTTQCQQAQWKSATGSDPDTYALQVRVNQPLQYQASRGQNPRVTCGISAIPIYDNPPKIPGPASTHQRVGGPRPMPVMHQHAGQAQTSMHRPIDPYNIMSMSTDMSTRFYPVSKTHRNRARLESPDALYTASGDPFSNRQQIYVPNSPVVPDPLTTQRKQVSAPLTYPRVLARPAVPIRALGMRGIPRIQKAQNTSNMIPTETQARSNMTGTPQTLHISVNSASQKSQSNGVQSNGTPGATPTRSAELKSQNQNLVLSETVVEKCSRCDNGLATRAMEVFDGRARHGVPRKLSTISANAPEVSNGFAIISTIDNEVESKDYGSAGDSLLEASSATILDVEEDLRDHSACCPRCCKMGCHEGCSGHKITATSIDQTSQKSRHRADSSSTLTSVSGESCTSSNTEHSSGTLSFIKAAFKPPSKHKRLAYMLLNNSSTEHIQKSQSTSTPATQFKDKSGLYSDADGASGFLGAMAAAKRAIGLDSSNASQEDGLNQFMVPKKRSTPKKVADQRASGPDNKMTYVTPVSSPAPRNVHRSTATSKMGKVKVVRPWDVDEISIVHDGQHRQISTSSISSTDIVMPAMNAMSLRAILEMVFTVPLEATRMCIRNNPEILSFGWVVMEYAYTWTCVITATGRLILYVIYIYSKTGKLKLRKADGGSVSVTEFLRNCLRSILYMVIFLSLSIIAGKFLKVLIWPAKILCMTVKYVVSGSRKIRLF